MSKPTAGQEAWPSSALVPSSQGPRGDADAPQDQPAGGGLPNEAGPNSGRGGWAGWPGPGQGAASDRIRSGGDRTSGRLGGRRNRHVPTGQRHPRPAGTGPGTGGGRPGGRDSPPAAPGPPRAGGWPTSTCTSSGGTSAPAWPFPGASCTRSSATTSRSGWAGPSGRWSGWTVRSVSPSTTATAASSTWSSALTGSAPPSGGQPDGDPVGRLGERFAGFAAPVPQLLEQLEDPAGVHVTAIEQVAAERWGRGAVALVGDAAHGMSPNMAQGAALAFEDALVLAAELRDAATVTDALAGFVARRSRRAGWVRAPDPPPRPHPQPPAGPARPHLAGLRTTDLPRPHRPLLEPI